MSIETVNIPVRIDGDCKYCKESLQEWKENPYSMLLLVYQDVNASGNATHQHIETYKSSWQLERFIESPFGKSNSFERKHTHGKT